jgi:hypothetical protein
MGGITNMSEEIKTWTPAEGVAKFKADTHAEKWLKFYAIAADGSLHEARR